MSRWSRPQGQVSFDLSQVKLEFAAAAELKCHIVVYFLLLIIISVDRGELVIRDLGNSFIHHSWTQLWNQVCVSQ